MSYSVNEAAKLVGKNPRKIKLDIRQGKLEASRLGDKPNSAYRIEYKDLRKPPLSPKQAATVHRCPALKVTQDLM